VRTEYDVSPGKYHVSVTAIDICSGIRGDGSACAVTLALKRALDIDRAEVTDRHIRVGALCGDGPESINAFIQAYDDNRDVEPFEFDLELDPVEYY
jgi:hypothetical protein